MPKTVIQETIHYPVIVHNENGNWGYVSPQFGGGGASSLKEAISLAQELIQAEASRLYEQSGDIPIPNEHVEADGGMVYMVPAEITNAAVRINITLPKTLIDQIDRVASNRSAYFAELARNSLHL